ncbi:hypothetical protein ABPG74_013944 [Tetrahymena malaccensis]
MNSIPFLFQNPQEIECDINGTYTPCTVEEMCTNKYKYRYPDEIHIQSITQQFDFVCDKQLTVASILGLAMGGQILGYILTMLYDFPKKIKSRMILYTVLAEVIVLFSVNYSDLNIISISAILFAWNFLFAFYFGQQYAYICDIYSADINNWAPVILGCMMPLFGIVYIGFAYVSSDWRNHLTKFTAIPLLILVLVFYNMYDYRDDETVDQTVEKSKNSRIEGLDLISTFLSHLKELLSSERWMMNSIVYFLCWVGSNCAYTTTFLVFNDITVGTFYKNLFVTAVFDFGSAFVAFFLAVYCRNNNRVKDLMFWTAIVTAIIQISSAFFPHNTSSTRTSYFLTMAPILISKAYSKIFVSCLLIDMPNQVPFKFLLILFSLSNICSLIFGSMMPLYYVFMNQMGVSVFITFGIVTLITAIYISKMTYMSDFEKKQSEIEQGDQQLPPQIAMAQTHVKRNSQQENQESTQQPLIQMDTRE